MACRFLGSFSNLFAIIFLTLFSISALAVQPPGDPRGTEVGQFLIKWEWDRVSGADEYEVVVDGSHTARTKDPQYFSFNMWAGEHSLTVRSIRGTEYSDSTPTVIIIVRDWYSSLVQNKSFMVGNESASSSLSVNAPPPPLTSESLNPPAGLYAQVLDTTSIKWGWDPIESAISYDIHADGGYSGSTRDPFFISENLKPGIHSAKVLAVYSGGGLSNFSDSINVDSTQGSGGTAPTISDLLDTVDLNSAYRIPVESEEYLRESSDSGNLPLLAYRASINEPASGLTITRITSNSAFGVVDGRARHEYSKRQPWNSDQTLLDVGGRVVDAQSYEIVGGFIPLTTERSWSNLEPNKIFGIYANAFNNSFSAYDVVTGRISEIIVMSGYEGCSIGEGEGNLSDNDEFVILVCHSIGSSQRTIFSVDVKLGVVLSKMQAQSNLNWAGFSQSGNYVVVENNLYPDSNPMLLIYDKFLGSPRVLGTPSHGDFGIDDQGNEVYAMISRYKIRYLRLSDGAYFELGISDTNRPIGNGHLSCRNSLRPGWCYFSSLEDSWMGAVYLSQTENKIEHWGYHRSNTYYYKSSPKAVANRTGDKLLFTSNWYGSGEINDYVLSGDGR